MPKDTCHQETRPLNFRDQSFLHEAQLAFLEELQSRGGSLIATSQAYQMKSSELARRACALGLMSFWQATDYDCERKSSRNLPSFIALEDCLVSLREKHGTFGEENNMLCLQAGIAKMRRDETWSLDTFLTFLKAGENLFACCRDEEGITSKYAPWGLDALDRMSTRILRESPRMREELTSMADAQIEIYFDHLSEEEINEGTFDIVAISRGESQSPAWIAGKLLAMGLVHLAAPALDPVLDRETRAATALQMDASPLTIASRYAESLSRIYHQDKRITAAGRHTMRLRLALAEAGLRQLTQTNADPYQVMTILDHLDKAAGVSAPFSNETVALSFAGHSRLFLAQQMSSAPR